MKPRSLLLWPLLAVAALAADQVDVFTSGEGGYHTYRIPAIVRAQDGSLLAFCEGRKKGGGDSGDIDLLLKRSGDQGRTWGPAQVVWDDAGNTCGNPCPVVDRESGTIWLLLTWNRGDDVERNIIARTSHDTRRIFVTHSQDQGRTWAQPVEITPAVKRPDWTWYATGPGAGIQIEHGAHRGRLVIPCDHIEGGSKRYYSHIIFSDDHGKTWQLGGRTPQDQVNECEVVELTGQRLLLNMRNYDRTKQTRQQAISRDGGATWAGQRHVPELVEPICQASIRRLTWPEAGRSGLLLFSNPASLKREKLTVYTSADEGSSWRPLLQLHGGPAAYSCLVALSATDAGCLYERGDKRAYERITFARFPVPATAR
jgi:sialidase-1